ncbi:Peptidyl-prolyl cis-trans isomerase PpiD [hydrothermal vent metagenome]|uniref:Peptidyl-prolyl cis-trans isomerase PpiD n=1 Tax=hydrothermal vent metagenome TaxID=652676 RepID=A0A1W1CBM3_9ZZZZ
MISWMQKHNKYLIVTIWIATIAFIGAGFVGWGSYQYGSKAGAIAKVGDVEITQEKFDMAYNSTYQRYNQMLQGKLDEKRAKEMGIIQQTFSSLAAQALLLNLANEFGIVVSDEEVLQELYKIPSFQTNGKFDDSIYKNYLKSQRLKPKTFEAVIHDETVVQKLLTLLDSKGFDFEKEVIRAAMGVSDKIAYKVIAPSDINVTIDDTKLKEYWEKHKSSYLVPKKYQLDIVWSSSDVNVTEAEISEFYKLNSFNYIDNDGRQLSIDDAKDQVTNDLKMKKSKKPAQIKYIEFKKGKIQKDEALTLDINDKTLSDEAWKSILSKDVNSVLKPKAIKNRYAIIKIVKIIEPKEMNFDEAKQFVIKEYEESLIEEEMKKIAENSLNDLNNSNPTISNFLSLNSKDNLNPLNRGESSQFLQKLFTSQKENGIISINRKIVVYNILEQKMVLDDNVVKQYVESSVSQIKKQDLQSNLIKNLDSKYKTEKFVEGI